MIVMSKSVLKKQGYDIWNDFFVKNPILRFEDCFLYMDNAFLRKRVFDYIIKAKKKPNLKYHKDMVEKVNWELLARIDQLLRFLLLISESKLFDAQISAKITVNCERYKNVIYTIKKLGISILLRFEKVTQKVILLSMMV